MPARPTDHAIDMVAVLLALGALLRGFDLVLDGESWWLPAMTVATSVAVGSVIVRALGTRIAWPVGAVAGFVVLAWLHLSETLVAGIPTPETVRQIVASLQSASEQIAVEPAPAPVTLQLAVLMSLVAGLLMVLADASMISDQNWIPIGIALLTLYGIPALISGQAPGASVFLPAAAAWLVLLRTRTTGISTGAAMVGLSLVMTVVITPLVPGLGAVARPFGESVGPVFGRDINPMLSLGDNLRQGSTQPAVEYTTSLDQAPYLRVATLRDFTRDTWEPSDPNQIAPDLVASAAQARQVSDTTRLSILNLRSSMLPVPYRLDRATGLRGDWTTQRDGMTMFSDDESTTGQTYAITSRSLPDEPDVVAELAAGSGAAGPDDLAPYLELPGQLPDSITSVASRAVEGVDSDYERGLALQSFFRGDTFTYSESTPVSEDYDGDGIEAIEAFLEVRSGYCVHFASSMAVMARSLSIPSRVVVGYAPGAFKTVRANRTTYEVTSDDLHAWVELYLGAAGWVRFDPTKGIGRPAPGAEELTPGSTEPTPTPSAAPTQAQPSPEPTAEPDSAVTETVSDGVTAVPWRLLAILLAVMVVVGTPASVRQLLRRRRLASTHDVEAHWREVLSTAVDLGREVPVGASPLRAARTLLDGVNGAESALERLVDAVERHRFALDPEQRPTLDDAVALVGSMTSGASRAARWRATLAPRSLWRRQSGAVPSPKGEPPMASRP